MTNIIQDVKSTGVTSGYVNVPFDEAKAQLEKAKYTLITLNKSLN